jgi:Cu-Zn family superoxide dismutase
MVMACGGAIAEGPKASSGAPPETPPWNLVAWARERPAFTAAEMAEIRDRFDVVAQLARDNTPIASVTATARASATLERADGSAALGAVDFEQEQTLVLIQATLSGLPPGEHGFTIHDAASCAEVAQRPAGHWNPTRGQHGPIESPARHVGDFGNLRVDADGKASFAMVTNRFRLGGDDTVVGKVVVIHARRDDGKTQPSGNSGAAVACGVIRSGGAGVALRD